MKSIGISRPVDNLGRIVIPIELRRGMDISEGDKIEIYTQGEFIVLEKCKSSCALCGSNNVSIEFEEKLLCESCLDKLQNIKSNIQKV